MIKERLLILVLRSILLKRKLLLLSSSVILIFIIFFTSSVSIINVSASIGTSTTIGTSNTNNDTVSANQRKIFYADSLFWVFYYKTTTSGVGLGSQTITSIVYCTSPDGLTWSNPTIVISGLRGMSILSGYLDIEAFSIYFDGVHVSYAATLESSAVGAGIYYGCGTPNSSGVITWLASGQYVGYTSYQSIYTSIGVDSSGYPYIAAFAHFSNIGLNRLALFKSSTNNGTWTTASGYPLILATHYSIPIVVPLTNNKIYIIYSMPGIYGKLYNGTSWGTEETIATDSNNEISAVAEGDNIHLVYLTATNDIKYIERTYNTPSWGNEVTVQSSTTNSSYPVISISSPNLYVFWAGSPTTNHIYYKKCVAGLWETNPTDWLNEGTEVLTRNDGLTCFYQADSNKIGLLYSTGTASPFNVKFAFLNVSITPTYSLNLRLLDKSGKPLSSAIINIVGNVQGIVNTEGSWANLTVPSGTYLVTTKWRENTVNQTSIIVKGSSVTTTVNCRVYYINFTNSFKDITGTALYTLPSSFKLTFPNNTASSSLNPTHSYLIQNGTTTWNSITWQGTEVTKSTSFNPEDGDPTVECKVFSLKVNPTFKDNLGLMAISPDIWSFTFPNSTIRTASTPLSYGQVQGGNYSITSIIWKTKEVITLLMPETKLTVNTVWAPSINCQLPTSISISLSSSTSYVGFQVRISGNLTCNEAGISGVDMPLSYSVTNGSSWNDIMLVKIAYDGR